MPVLTKEERTSIFELLGLAQSGTLDWYDYSNLTTGPSTSLPIGAQIDFTKATDQLTVILNAIDTADDTDGRRARLTDIIAEYDAIYMTVAKFDGNQAGQITMDLDFFVKRLHLRTLLETVLGFQLKHQRTGAWQINLVR